MKAKNYRLDRFISQHSNYSLAEVHLLVAQKRILLDDKIAGSVQSKVTPFTQVVLDGDCLQNNKPVYLMLNKPQGVVSATKDDKHTTVLDLIQHPQREELHVVGRLDINTTGMVLLTNDGAWSKKISLPESKVSKTYEVTLTEPLDNRYVTKFIEGIYFRYENITTKPAHLELVSEFRARLTLFEGKYHQVKRMFGFFQNEVTALHRVSIGNLYLGDLETGASRILSTSEVNGL